MNKQQLLELEKNAHLTVAELREAQPDLATPVTERLEKRAQRAAIARLGGGSEKLREVAEKITVPIGVSPRETRLRSSALRALREAVANDPRLAADREVTKELEELEAAAARPPVPGEKPEATLADTLRLDEPLAFNPEFRRDLDAARVYRLSDATGLPDSTAKVLIDNAGSVPEITDERLAALVEERKLTPDEAASAGLASSLYNLLDERPELVAAAKPGLAAVSDLAKHDKDAWIKIIKTSKTSPPGDLSIDEYADLLNRKVTQLFPTEGLANRLAKVKVASVMKEHARLSELRRLNPETPIAATADFNSFKTDGIDADELKKLKERHAVTVTLVNQYAGMRLASVMDDPSLSDADKQREVARRTGLATGFLADNPEILGADLTPRSAEVETLKFPAGTSAADKTMVLAHARTYQRAMAITEDLADAEALVSGGFRSALEVAAAPPGALAARTGLKADAIDRYRDKAKGIASGVTAHIGTLLDIVKGGFKDTGVGNVSPAVLDYLKEIPGFADFFGSQDFCNCTHCQSILSPAAYFVDLMCFVDEHITQSAFAGKPSHPLKLQSRRPDLWTLETGTAEDLTPAEHAAVLAYMLSETGYKLGAQPLDAANAKTIKLR